MFCELRFPAMLTFLKGVAISFTGLVFLGVVNYLIRRYLALNLPAVDYGFFYSMFALYSLLTMFFQFGAKQASAIFISSYIAKHQEKRIGLLISGLLKITIISGLVLMLILILGRNILAQLFFKYPAASVAVAIFAPFVLINPVWSIILSIPHGKLEFWLYNALTVFEMLLIYLGILSFSRYGLAAIILSWILACVIALFVAAMVVFRRYHLTISLRAAFCHRMNQKIWNLCGWMSGSSSGIIMLSFLDTICLTWLTDLHQVATYNIAMPIMQIIQALSVLPLVFLPFSAKLWKEKKYAELNKVFLLVNVCLAVGIIPMVVVMHLFGQWIVSIMFGKQFIAAASALPILAAGNLCYVAGQFNLNLLNSVGRQKVGMFIVIAAVAADFVLNLVLVVRYGFRGAAISLSCSYFIIALFTFIFSMYSLKHPHEYRTNEVQEK